MNNIKGVSCIVEDMDDDVGFKQRYIENIRRMDPIEEAEFFERWKQQCGITYIEIARKIGKSVDYIYKRIRLLELPESAKDEIKRKYKRLRNHQYI
ncbi:MAG: hypothetical protein L6N95_03315 [Candidatus Methylarchaceae archaeon HK01B]|nr:hypothetical protein [Candidatus Methylarchaceae archaeon HK01B]